MNNPISKQASVFLAWLVAVLAITAGCNKQQTPPPSAEASTRPAEEEQLKAIEEAYAGRAKAAAPTESSAYVQASVEGISDTWQAGREHDITLKLVIAEGWHINANPATFDYLVPTAFTIKEPAGVTVVSVTYPKGTPFKVAQLNQPIAVYEKAVIIPIRVRLAPGTQPGTVKVRGELKVQACNDRTCLAPSAIAVEWKVSVAGGADGV